MNAWINFASMIIAGILMTIFYLMSIRPAHLEQKIGEKAYKRCGIYRNICSIFMFVLMANYILYPRYPLPFDPFPVKFQWPYWVSIVIAVLIAIPSLYLDIISTKAAKSETMMPDKSHTMYSGIYEKIRHPMTVGELPLWWVISFVVNSPFLVVFSFIWIPVWYWWCVAEEKDLVLRYGEPYIQYRERTGMFFPKKIGIGENMMEQTINAQNKPEKYQRTLIRIVAIIQTLYGLVEISDTVTAALMSAGLVNNPYPAMAFSEIQAIFDKEPIWIVPLFFFYTSIRITSAIGLWKNRLWGFWLTIFISMATLIMAPFLLPFTTAEMLLDGIIIMLLLIGYLGKRQIFVSE